MRLLRLLLATAVGALTLVVVTGAPSFACSCVTSGTRDFVDRAEVVLTGTVTDVAPPPERAVMSSMDPRTYTVAVDGVLKGAAGGSVTVLSPMSGASCGLEGVREGRRYVVFASHQSMTGRDEEHLWANLCGGTAPATPAFVTEVEAVTGAGTEPAEDGPAYSSDLEVTFDEPEGGFVAVPVALAAGAGLLLLAGSLWVRLVLRR
jgi:hypothetical protein